MSFRLLCLISFVLYEFVLFRVGLLLVGLLRIGRMFEFLLHPNFTLLEYNFFSGCNQNEYVSNWTKLGLRLGHIVLESSLVHVWILRIEFGRVVRLKHLLRVLSLMIVLLPPVFAPPFLHSSLCIFVCVNRVIF